MSELKIGTIVIVHASSDYASGNIEAHFGQHMLKLELNATQMAEFTSIAMDIATSHQDKIAKEIAEAVPTCLMPPEVFDAEYTETETAAYSEVEKDYPL